MAVEALPVAMVAGSGKLWRCEVGEMAEGHHGGVVHLLWASGDESQHRRQPMFAHFGQ
jgi:hypothetical protein